MKTQRNAPWMYCGAAILIFVLVMLASARLTMVLAPSADFREIASWFHPQVVQTTFLPILGRSAVSEANPTDYTTQDNGLGLEGWDETVNP